jgi:5-methylcytosine-specific restriction enzyme A
MPGRAYRICAKAGCNKLSVGKYCAIHAGHDARQRKALDVERSADPIRKLYFTATWLATRRIVLARDRICAKCKRAFTTVCDHVIAARQWVAQHNGDLESFFDDSNLQGLCKPCHDTKKAVEESAA